MHQSAMLHGRLFFEGYVSGQVSTDFKVVEIGSQNVNGSLRDVCPSSATYIGLDFVQGLGVDVILDDPYTLPIESETVDVVVCSSCLEHSEFFWLVFLEALRILKPSGLFYLNAPSNGFFHRWPVDCWRFYPDSGIALARWGERNGMQPVVLESFVGGRSEGTVAQGGMWNDFVAVFLKDRSQLHLHPRRILHSLRDYSNGHVHGSDQTLRFNEREADFSLIQSQLEQLELSKQALEAVMLETDEVKKSKADLEHALRELVDSSVRRDAQLDSIFGSLGEMSLNLKKREADFSLIQSQLEKLELSKQALEAVMLESAEVKKNKADLEHALRDNDALAHAANESIAALAQANHEKQAMEHLLIEMRERLTSAKRQIHDMENSRSWRLTSPYRWIGRKLRGAR